jgi:hypothetical protein
MSACSLPDHQLAAIRQFEAMQARKDQDIQEEWLMRQKEKTKHVSELLDGKLLAEFISQAETEIGVLGADIDELEVSSTRRACIHAS